MIDLVAKVLSMMSLKWELWKYLRNMWTLPQLPKFPPKYHLT